MITTDEITKRFLQIKHDYDVVLAENERLRRENEELHRALESGPTFTEKRNAKEIVQEIYESIMKAS